MKIITLEEHFQLAEIKKAVAKMLPSFAHGFHLPSYDAPDSQLEDLGADRIMYAVDYPFIAGDQARTFLEYAPISPADKEKIAYGNAEKVLKFSPNNLNRLRPATS